VDASLFHDVPGAGRVRALVAGEGPRPLLLVHGWPSGARTFWPLLADPRLCARYRLAAPDLFGFGRSELSAGPLTFAHQVEAVLEVARAQRGGPVVGVGVSFGARVLLEAAARAPGLFGRLLLLAPYLHRGLLRPGLCARMLVGLPRPVCRLLYGPPLSVVTGLWAAGSSFLARPAPRHALPAWRLVGDVARMRPETVDLLRDLPDGRPLLRAPGPPVELWYGSEDDLLDTAGLEALGPGPRVALVRVEGARHALHETHAGIVAAALLEGP